jgi:hypothetical protein
MDEAFPSSIDPMSEGPAAVISLVGLTALVEIGPLEITGQVTELDGVHVTVTADADVPGEAELDKVLISVFAPSALFRISGSARRAGRDVTTEDNTTIDRIQRRKWPRRRMDMAVTLCPVADGMRVEGVPGRTIDVSIGGLCVETLRPVEGEGDPMVILSLPDGTSIVSSAATVAVEDLGDGWRYRLAFRDLDPHDAGRLAALTTA